jgi:Fibronectin type III domain.
MTVTWAEPLSFGNGTFQKYQVFIRESGTEGWPTTPAEEFTDSSTESTTLSDLVNGTSYDVKIVVVTDQGSQETISLGVAATVPDPPTDLTVEVLSMTSVFASWTAPAYNGGSAITGYPISPSCTPETATDTFCVITGLTPGSTVTVRVAASNLIGSSSSAAKTVTLPAPPSPPSDGGSGNPGTGGEPPANPVTVPEGIRNGSESAEVTVNGATVPIQILENPTSGQVEMLGPDFLLRVDTADQAGAPMPMNDSRWLRVPQGGRVNAAR